MERAGGKLPRGLKIDGQNLGIFPNQGTSPSIPTMTTQTAVSGETYREKALRKFKQQPLVPVGAPSLAVHVEAY